MPLYTTWVYNEGYEAHRALYSLLIFGRNRGNEAPRDLLLYTRFTVGRAVRVPLYSLFLWEEPLRRVASPAPRMCIKLINITVLRRITVFLSVCKTR